MSELKKLTKEQIINLQTGLSKIATLSEQKHEDRELPFKVVYQNSRIITSIRNVLEAFNKERDAIIKDYATAVYTEDPRKLDKDGKPIREFTNQYSFEDPEKQFEYQEKINTILEIEEDIDIPWRFKVSELAPLAPLGFGSNSFVSLEPLIDDDFQEYFANEQERIKKEKEKEELEKNKKR